MTQRVPEQLNSLGLQGLDIGECVGAQVKGGDRAGFLKGNPHSLAVLGQSKVFRLEVTRKGSLILVNHSIECILLKHGPGVGPERPAHAVGQHCSTVGCHVGLEVVEVEGRSGIVGNLLCELNDCHSTVRVVCAFKNIIKVKG